MQARYIWSFKSEGIESIQKVEYNLKFVRGNYLSSFHSYCLIRSSLASDKEQVWWIDIDPPSCPTTGICPQY